MVISNLPKLKCKCNFILTNVSCTNVLHNQINQLTSKLVNKDVAVYIYNMNTVQNYIINRSRKVTCKC